MLSAVPQRNREYTAQPHLFDGHFSHVWERGEDGRVVERQVVPREHEPPLSEKQVPPLRLVASREWPRHPVP